MPSPEPSAPSTARAAQVLLVANRTCPCPDVLDAVKQHAGAHGRVHVVVPALNGRLRHLVSDVDDAVRAATERLQTALDYLGASGVPATGEVGDSDPVLAVGDALHRFRADELVVSTYPRGDSNWLERDLPGRLARRYRRPITHLVSHHGLLAAAA